MTNVPWLLPEELKIGAPPQGCQATPGLSGSAQQTPANLLCCCRAGDESKWAEFIHPSEVPTVPTAGGQGQQDVSKQGAVTKEEDRQQTHHKDKVVQTLGLSLWDRKQILGKALTVRRNSTKETLPSCPLNSTGSQRKLRGTRVWGVTSAPYHHPEHEAGLASLRILPSRCRLCDLWPPALLCPWSLPKPALARRLTRRPGIWTHTPLLSFGEVIWCLTSNTELFTSVSYRWHRDLGDLFSLKLPTWSKEPKEDGNGESET